MMKNKKVLKGVMKKVWRQFREGFLSRRLEEYIYYLGG